MAETRPEIACDGGVTGTKSNEVAGSPELRTGHHRNHGTARLRRDTLLTSWQHSLHEVPGNSCIFSVTFSSLQSCGMV